MQRLWRDRRLHVSLSVPLVRVVNLLSFSRGPRWFRLFQYMLRGYQRAFFTNGSPATVKMESWMTNPKHELCFLAEFIKHPLHEVNRENKWRETKRGRAGLYLSKYTLRNYFPKLHCIYIFFYSGSYDWVFALMQFFLHRWMRLLPLSTWLLLRLLVWIQRKATLTVEPLPSDILLVLLEHALLPTWFMSSGSLYVQYVRADTITLSSSE